MNRAFQLSRSQKTIDAVFITLLTFVVRSEVVDLCLNALPLPFHILVDLSNSLTQYGTQEYVAV